MTAPPLGRRRRGFVSWYVPTGRIRRSHWWTRYVLVLLLVGLIASWLDARWFPDSYPRLTSPDGLDLLWPWPDRGGPLTALGALAALVPNTAAMVTRLHDRDHSAAWLLWFLLPGIGWLVLFVTIALLGSQPRPNRYGSPPR